MIQRLIKNRESAIPRDDPVLTSEDERKRQEEEAKEKPVDPE
jgi:hypothetical protein